jgi:hypothetical protein
MSTGVIRNLFTFYVTIIYNMLNLINQAWEKHTTINENQVIPN